MADNQVITVSPTMLFTDEFEQSSKDTNHMV